MKKLLSPWWALITLSALIYLFMTPPAFFQSVKLNYFDQLIINQEPVDNNIYVAEIDDAALELYGQYPFPRNIYSDIIKDLYNRGAGIVIWNVMMPEQDRFGGDAELAETMMALPVILASRPSDKTVNLPINPGAAILQPQYLDRILPYGGIIANIPMLENSSVGAGIVSTEPEIDGVVRRMPTVAVVDGTLYPSLALETLRVIAGDPNFQIKLNQFGVEKMRIPQFGPIPTDSEGRVWIDWSQQSKRVSVADLPNDFGGAVVIVDVTAAGIANPVPTATGAQFAGTTQAAVIGTMFNGTNIQRPDWAPTAELVGLAIGGLILILLSRWMLVGLVVTVGLISGVLPYSWHMFATEKALIDVTAPIITLVIIALQVYGIKFVREFLEKQAIKKQFAGYASPTVVRLLQENPALIKEGMKREVSILFSDLRGFTPLGESFGDDVKGLTKIMNGYMDAITQPVLDMDGMIIKYIGDASMHIHNAPIEDPEHPKTAVQCGLEMLRAVEKFNDKITAEGRPPVGMGAGINTGLGYLGEMGSTKRHSYDVLGDAVSTAARIESKCKEYGCLLLVGEATYKETKDDFFYLKVDDLQVKGKSVGLSIYTVLDIAGTPAQIKSKEIHERMHECYRAQKFDDAIKECNKLMRHFDGKMEGYYKMWIERCEFQKTQKLPKDWNGVFIAQSK
ncbi:MAG: adenylate/guanylate cyclase domain-containing protein [Euryarchaeota archaeon]|jgi:adenylate cyclase